MSTTAVGSGRSDAAAEALGVVDEIMQRGVVALRCDEKLAEAIRDLERAGISGAPVMDGDRVVGIATLADLFEAAGVPPRQAATTGPWHRYEHLIATIPATVETAMTGSVVTVPPGTPITAVAAVMEINGVNRIPVVSADGRLAGIVARDDIVRAVARLARSVYNDPPRPRTMAPD